MRNPPTLELEKLLLSEGIEFIAGVDEAGRGPVAGPVTAAAVIFPVRKLSEILTAPGKAGESGTSLSMVRDSKELTEANRGRTAEAIKEHALEFSVAHVPNEIIDEINILNATRLAVRKAVDALTIRPAVILIDGKYLNLKDRTCISIVKGDATVFSIAAASIMAKTSRDELMREYAGEFPHYCFERNKGYLTQRHLEAIRSHGLTTIHRKSFTIPI